MKMLSASLAVILSVTTVLEVVAEVRVATPYPEDLQLINAAKAATDGIDEPLAEPIFAPVSSIIVPDLTTPSTIEERAEEALKTATLEEQISDQSISQELTQFGYDIFSSIPTTFAPVDGIPVPPDYVIGPGDTFLLQLFSTTDVQYTLVVSREGRLLVPEIGDIQVSGLTFEDAQTLLKERIARTRMGVKVVVTLDKLRTIQVMMLGEVVQPGTYTVSGLSSLVNTLITTGGIKRSGSLREISLKRGGQTVASLDLYDLLLKGDTSTNPYLRQGDVIFIPPIGSTVSIAGEVNRPAIYEITEEETVGELIELAGGLLPTAAKRTTQIERIKDDGTYTLIQANLDAEGYLSPIKNGDVLRIYPVTDRMDNVVLLAGNVVAPGGYEWRLGMRLSDLIPNSELLRQRTDFGIALIEREDRILKTTEVRYFNLQEALSNPQSATDPVLYPRDTVVIFDTYTERSKLLTNIIRKMEEQTLSTALPNVVEIRGFVQHPGKYPLQSGHRLIDVINYAGGLKLGVDRDYMLLLRTDAKSNRLDFIRLRLDSALLAKTGDHNPIIKPSDRLYLFDDKLNRADLISDDLDRIQQQASYGEPALIVDVKGSVNHPGRYPLTPGMRVSDLIAAGGGMAEGGFGLAATLSRQQILDGEFSRLDQQVVSLTTNNPMLNNLDTILKPYDSLVLRSKPEWSNTPNRVRIEGEVLYPGEYTVDKRESLCGIVNKVGGFTEDAYLFGTVFTRESVRQREQEAIDRILRQMDDLLAEVHLSPGYNKESKLPVQQGTTDTFRVIQQLKPESAVGRMVIDMQAAVQRCDESADFVLEDGDYIYIPKLKQEVSVAGQVYFPTSHQYLENRGAYDYINLSGGTKELAQREHAYVVQANGEVMTMRSPASTWGWLGSPKNLKVTPGSTIYVPLSVDRINGREFTESWVDLIYKLTISAASVDFLFSGSN